MYDDRVQSLAGCVPYADTIGPYEPAINACAAKGCRLPVLPASEDAHIAGEVTALTVPGENFVGRGTCRPDLRWSESGRKDAQPIFATTCSSRIHNC